VHPGDVCLDIGAEYGLYTLALAACCGPNGRVHGIEPQPDAFRVLRTGVNLLADRRTIRLHRHALADRPQRGWMSVPRRGGLPVHGRAFLTDGATEPGPNAIEFRVARWLPVEVTTLDTFCAQQKIDRLDFIKADVEGAEIKVLRGGMDTLTKHRPILQLEIQEPHIAKYGASAADIVDLLSGLGYTMHTWRCGAWQRVDRVTEQRRNYLFVP
jgi:FkbM family methyltransferase